MNNPVMIKGNKFGIVLVLDDVMPFPKLCDKIRMKFMESNKFFDKNVQMAISFEGRQLTNEEQDYILEIINQCCDLEISYIIDKNNETERLFENCIKGSTSEPEPAELKNPEVVEVSQESASASVIPGHADIEAVGSVDNLNTHISEMEIGSDDLGHFYRGTIRSGQSVEFASSIVVVGDVNPGAKVVAKGNIIIIGSLKGSAYAGVNGKQNSFIIALDMDPMQLRIGEFYARSPDSVKGKLFKKKKQQVKEMQIAFVENNNIYIEPINRSVLNSII